MLRNRFHHCRTKAYGLCLALALLSAQVPLLAEIRVPSDVALKAALKKVDPEYPQIAKQMRVTGKVCVDITVDTDGNVSDVKVMSGNALLTQPVMNALKKWKFAPFTGSNGEPTKAIAQIDFEFKL